MKPKLYTLLLIAIITYMASCKPESNTEVITSATPKYDPDKPVILPPESDNYEVLGKMKGLKGFVVKYDANLYRGGEFYSPEGIETLKDLGIRTIVTVTPNDTERYLARENNMTLIEVPFDEISLLSKNDLETVLSVFPEGDLPVYIHCHGGTHRAGILAVAYRIHKLGWSWEKALLEYGYLGGDLKDDQIMLQAVGKKSD